MSQQVGFMPGIGHNGGPALHDRSYQTEAVSSLWTYFETHSSGNPLVAMPTGTGKSVVIARFLQSVFSRFPNQKVLVLTHVKELIQQNYEKLMTAWPFAPAGIYSAGLNQKVHNKPITFGGIASVAKKWALFGHVDLVLIDEAHLVSPTEATMYQTFLAGLLSINPYLRIVGFTATPWRLGHGKLTDPVVREKRVDRGGVSALEIVEEPSLFTDVCFDITGIEAFNRLIAEGFLIPLISRPTKTQLDVAGVHMRGGEFIEKELQTAVDKDEITEACLREAMEYGHNRKKWLIFAAGTDHADHICDMLNRLGIPTGCVHSKREGRDQTIKDFKAGKLRAVVNNNVLTTGFDDPEIDLIICLRPTASAVLWVQMLGRGTRPFWALGPDGKPDPRYDLNDIGGRLASIEAGGKLNCLVLDYAANAKRLGPINDPVTPRRKGQGKGEAPIKECPKCHNDVHASLRFCNAIIDFDTNQKCDHEFVFESKLMQSASSTELVKGDLPVVKVFRVEHITVSEHEKMGAPPMMKVSYYCGFQKFDDYVCVEHTNFAARKARQWWTQRCDLPFPTTTADAIAVAGMIKPATHLRVWINKKYPEILAYCFDGSAFGTQEANPAEIPFVQTEKPRSSRNDYSDLDEEIPF